MNKKDAFHTSFPLLLFPLSTTTGIYPIYPTSYLVALIFTIIIGVIFLTIKSMNKKDTAMHISLPLLFISLYIVLSTSAEIYSTIHYEALLSTILFGIIFIVSILYRLLQNTKKKKVLSIFQIDLNPR